MKKFQFLNAGDWADPLADLFPAKNDPCPKTIISLTGQKESRRQWGSTLQFKGRIDLISSCAQMMQETPCIITMEEDTHAGYHTKEGIITRGGLDNTEEYTLRLFFGPADFQRFQEQLEEGPSSFRIMVEVNNFSFASSSHAVEHIHFTLTNLRQSA